MFLRTARWFLPTWSSPNSRRTNLESLHQDHFRYVCLDLWTAGGHSESRAELLPGWRLSEQAYPLLIHMCQGTHDFVTLWLCSCPRVGSGCWPERKVCHFGYIHDPLTFTWLLLQTHVDLNIHVASPFPKTNWWLKFEEHRPVIPLSSLACRARTNIEFSLDALCLGGFAIHWTPSCVMVSGIPTLCKAEDLRWNLWKCSAPRRG